MISIYFELSSCQQGFLTVPVSSATTEWTFIKMKPIKTSVRNSMSNSRLNDLSFLAMETDFTIDFEQIIVPLPFQHKNSQTMLG
jgi:hypothetical protein